MWTDPHAHLDLHRQQMAEFERRVRRGPAPPRRTRRSRLALLAARLREGAPRPQRPGTAEGSPHAPGEA